MGTNTKFRTIILDGREVHPILFLFKVINIYPQLINSPPLETPSEKGDSGNELSKKYL